MNAVGIIAEYNPFHNGHRYLIEEAKNIAGSNAVVVAMSGNFVQRGEPAILNKWERARLALLNGADLVVEIPTLFCLGNATQYAVGGMEILESMPLVNTFAFGSESGDADSLVLTALNMDRASSELQYGITKLIKNGVSYPAARAQVYKELFPNAAELPDKPNDILAVEYLRASRRLNHIAVKRLGADYNDNEVNEIFMSASGIRNAVKNKLPYEQSVPYDTELSLKDSKVTFPDDWLSTLRYAVISMNAEDIDKCPSGGEGLGNRIKSAINNANTWDELVELVKSKRYTHTRISRLFMQIIIGINRELYSFDKPQYIRILGANERGRKLAADMKKKDTCDLPMITNINKQMELLNEEGRKQLELDIHAVDIYNLVTGRDHYQCSDYKTKPIIIR